MTQADSNPNKSDNLVQQLEGLRFIIDVDRDVLNANPVLIEFLGFKIDMAQSLIEELQSWEELGNQSKCNQAIENAQFFMKQIEVLIDRMLDVECEKTWLSSQVDLRFDHYSPTAYEYVLRNNIKVCSSSIAG